MHSALFMTVYRRLAPEFPFVKPFDCFFDDNSCRSALVILLFPVASRPWTTMFREGALRIYGETGQL
jgi:hypothetical protein